MTRRDLLSISGGKDSTALLLLAYEREVAFDAVFADTGHEHQATYDYVNRLSAWLESKGLAPIRWVRADFSKDINRKREFVANKWPGLLTTGKPGRWKWVGNPQGNEVDSCGPVALEEIEDEDGETATVGSALPPEPPVPADPYLPIKGKPWQWVPAVRPMAEDEAAEIVSRALAVLKPSGNPFLDLCVMKGRFPSTMARFCSQMLKHEPIFEQVVDPILEAGDELYSWQGVRAEESAARAKLTELEHVGGGLWNYRPILQWKVEEVFAMHRKHGIDPNPLYLQGMGRVGCMPCIHSRKDEVREIANRWPDEVARVAEWERIVSQASKLGTATFFAADKADARGMANEDIGHETHGITAIVEWSRTTKNRRQFDLVSMFEEPAMCSSIYGLCE